MNEPRSDTRPSLYSRWKERIDRTQQAKQKKQVKDAYDEWVINGHELRKALQLYEQVARQEDASEASSQEKVAEFDKEIRKSLRKIRPIATRLGFSWPLSNGQGASKKKKNWVESLVFYALFLFVIFLLGSVFGTQSSNGVPRNIAGYAPMTILTKSMERVYPKDTFILTKVTDPKTFTIGDDITYIKENNTTVTHRIVGIDENYLGTGERGFETKGVENPRKDEKVVRQSNVVGKVVFSSEVLGKTIVFVREHMVLTAGTLLGFFFLLDLLFKYITLSFRKGEKHTS